MKLFLERYEFTEKSTIGRLYKEIPLGGDNFEYEELCYILEDKCRQKFGEPFTQATKVYGQTAIPYGTYEVVVNKSPKYGKLMPRLLNVPFYDGILIHSGNTDKDSSGCLICGKTKSADFVGESKKAFDEIVFPLLEKTLKTEKVFIEIGIAE
ncbi:MAG: DUF5675 family protein [Candidatus Pacearchaeota archaeon]